MRLFATRLDHSGGQGNSEHHSSTAHIITDYGGHEIIDEKKIRTYEKSARRRRERGGNPQAQLRLASSRTAPFAPRVPGNEVMGRNMMGLAALGVLGLTSW